LPKVAKYPPRNGDTGAITVAAPRLSVIECRLSQFNQRIFMSDKIWFKNRHMIFHEMHDPETGESQWQHS
jgi:hypothetical protein